MSTRVDRPNTSTSSGEQAGDRRAASLRKHLQVAQWPGNEVPAPVRAAVRGAILAAIGAPPAAGQ